MASHSHSILLFFTLSITISLLISPSYSSCTSQKFTNKKTFTNCTELPTLNATLHYTYNETNSSLSIAFVAKPSKADGWVAWAVNLNGTGMANSQALIAMKSNTSSITVKKYSIVSYREINETNKLSVDTWDVSGESEAESGNFIIFSGVKLPESLEKVNHIWQVGPSVTNGFPDKHEFTQNNLMAKGNLAFVSSTSINGNTTTTSTNSTTSNNDKASAGFRVQEINFAYQFGLFFVIIGSFLSFW